MRASPGPGSGTRAGDGSVAARRHADATTELTAREIRIVPPHLTGKHCDRRVCGAQKTRHALRPQHRQIRDGRLPIRLHEHTAKLRLRQVHLVGEVCHRPATFRVGPVTPRRRARSRRPMTFRYPPRVHPRALLGRCVVGPRVAGRTPGRGGRGRPLSPAAAPLCGLRSPDLASSRSGRGPVATASGGTRPDTAEPAPSCRRRAGDPTAVLG